MKLFYRIIGEGYPIVILHGLFGQSDNWQTMAKSLADQGFKVITVDQRNHGQSAQSTDWNYNFMQQDLLQLFVDLELTQAHIIGHSMGGKTAMEFAYANPTLVNKLFVVDIGPKHYPVHHGQIIEALQSVDLLNITQRKEAEQVLENRGLDFGNRQFLLKNLYWNSQEKLAWRFNLEVISKNIIEVGKESLQNKVYLGATYFIRGTKSNYIANNDWTDIKNKFLNANLYDIDNAGHWVHAEQPVLFLNVVLTLLRN